MAAFTSRQTIDPSDPWRREFWAWDSTGPWDPNSLSTFALRPASGPDVDCDVTFSEMSWHYCVRLRVPAGSAPGSYTLVVDGMTTGRAVTVVAPRGSRPVAHVGPISAWATRAGDLLSGGYDVVLLPGYYRLAAALTVPAGARLTGYGATVVCAGSAQILHTGGGSSTEGTTIEGVTFLGDGQYPFSFGSNPSPEQEDVTFVRCEFHDLRLGHARGVYHCTFRRAGIVADGSTPRIVYGCEFREPAEGSTPLYFNGCADGGLAVINNEFRSTGRGIGFNGGAAAPTSGHLVWFNAAYDLKQKGNGNEFILFEGGAASSDNLVGHNQAIGASNTCVMFFDAGGARNTIVYNRQVGGSIGIWLAPYSAGTTFTAVRVHNNVFQRVRHPVLVGAYDPVASAAVKGVDPEEIDFGLTTEYTANTFDADAAGPLPPYAAPVADPGVRVRSPSAPWAWEETEILDTWPGSD